MSVSYSTSILSSSIPKRVSKKHYEKEEPEGLSKESSKESKEEKKLTREEVKERIDLLEKIFDVYSRYEEIFKDRSISLDTLVGDDIQLISIAQEAIKSHQLGKKFCIKEHKQTEKEKEQVEIYLKHFEERKIISGQITDLKDFLKTEKTINNVNKLNESLLVIGPRTIVDLEKKKLIELDNDLKHVKIIGDFIYMKNEYNEDVTDVYNKEDFLNENKERKIIDRIDVPIRHIYI